MGASIAAFYSAPDQRAPGDLTVAARHVGREGREGPGPFESAGGLERRASTRSSSFFAPSSPKRFG